MPIPQNQLVTFKELPDGNLEATLQRLGRLVVRLPNSPLSLEISIERDKKKDFRCFVRTKLSGDEKQNEEARKANGGLTPEILHVLCKTGGIRPYETTTSKPQQKHSNKPASDPAGGDPGAEREPEPESEPGSGDSGDQETGGTDREDETGGDEAAAGGAGE